MVATENDGERESRQTNREMEQKKKRERGKQNNGEPDSIHLTPVYPNT